MFTLDRRSKTALALRNLDTRLAVRFSVPALLPLEPRDEAVEPFMLLLLPLTGELFSFVSCCWLLVKPLILCIDEEVAADEDEDEDDDE